MLAPCLIESIEEASPEVQDAMAAVFEAVELDALVTAAQSLAQLIAAMIVSKVLNQRAEEKQAWPACPECGSQTHSRGRKNRMVRTMMGRVTFRRPVGRCSKGCAIGQICPFDEALGLKPNQRTSTAMKIEACRLAVFVPYETVSALLKPLTRMEISSSAVWQWVQTVGKHAMADLEAEIEAMNKGCPPKAEAIAAKVAELVAIIGADGVMVPFRPNPGERGGATVWREVKVAVFARLQKIQTRSGEMAGRLWQRRVVAVLGDTDQLAAHMRLEAIRQRVFEAPRLAWISDGARGLWRIFETHFDPKATGILDFYHAAGQLHEAVVAWYGFPTSVEIVFRQLRHDLRHGKVASVISRLEKGLEETFYEKEQRQTIQRVVNYLRRHSDRLAYPDFEESGMPLGSGFVESAVKWLIQQRFKGTGMRWSEDGFNHLLMLRQAWANDRFDETCEAAFAASPT